MPFVVIFVDLFLTIAVRKKINDKDFQWWMTGGLFCLDIILVSFFYFALTMDPVIGKEAVFTGVFPLVYVIFIVLSTGNLKKITVLFTTILSSLLYLGISIYYLERNVCPEFYTYAAIEKSFLIFISGLFSFMLTSYRHDLNKETHNTHLSILKKHLTRSHDKITLKDGEHRIRKYQIFVKEVTTSDFTGGDFVITKNVKGGFLLIVGDIVGNGIEVSAYVGFVSALFLSLAETEPDAILKKINNIYMKIKPEDIEFTACCLLLKDSGEVSFSGFQEKILIIRESESKENNIETIHTQGPLLGLKEQKVLKIKKFFLQKGDGFVLYTDGMYSSESDEDKTLVIVTYTGSSSSSPSSIIV